LLQKTVGITLCPKFSGSHIPWLSPGTTTRSQSSDFIEPLAVFRANGRGVNRLDECLNLALRRCRRILQEQTVERSLFDHKLQDLPKDFQLASGTGVALVNGLSSLSMAEFG
jgi:hypothetical protein